jgi:hypothetical protein
MKHLNHIVENWINKNIKTKNPFFKKLLVLWPKIIGSKLGKYSIPYSFLTENSQNILIIYVYNGAVSLKIQSMIPILKNQILIHIGYQPVNEIRIIQKMNFCDY